MKRNLNPFLQLLFTIKNSIKLSIYIIFIFFHNVLFSQPASFWDLYGNNIQSTEFLGTINSKPLVFKTNDTERARITEIGNFGIGITNPKHILHVHDTRTISPIPIEQTLQSSFKGLGVSYAYSCVQITNKETGTEETDGLLVYTRNNDAGIKLQEAGKLELQAGSSRISLLNNGNTGINTNDPRQKLHINGNILISGKNSTLLFGFAPYKDWGEWGIEYNKDAGGLNFWKPSGSIGGHTNYNLFLSNNNNVGIGTNNPIAKLQVNHNSDVDWSYGIMLEVNRDLTKAFTITNTLLKEDIFMIWGNGIVNTKTIYAEAVKVRPVTIGTYWPDYVFEDKYNLTPISELYKFIQIHNHLPDVPTQSEVLENGIDLFEMNLILLKKVEELTLYTIMQQQQIDILSDKINNTYATIKDSTEINKSWNFGFSLFNTLYWVNEYNMYDRPQHLNNGLGILACADYRIFKNLYIDFGIGIKKVKLSWPEKTVNGITQKESFQITDLCMPLSIKYSFTHYKRKTNFYLKAGILREAVIDTKYTDMVKLYSNDFAYQTKDIIGNILFYRYNHNINDFFRFVNIGVSYPIFKIYRLNTEIECLMNNGIKQTGLSIYGDLLMKPYYLSMKIGFIF